MSAKILIIDDEDDIRSLIESLLKDEGYETLTASSSAQAYEIIETSPPDLIIQDIWLQGSDDDGIEILKNTKKTHPYLPFIMISGHGTIQTAVTSLKLGAYDFIEKPFKSDRLLLMIHRAIENAVLKIQNEDLKQQASENLHLMTKQLPESLLQTLEKTASSNSRVFITGGAGSGKNIAARYIHQHSQRAAMPYVTLNCIQSSADKIEAELFEGILERVNGGTLVLNEAMQLPLSTQGKLLDILQENAYYKNGVDEKISLDIRIITTTSVIPEPKVKSGGFREDLFYRLNVMPIQIPSLKQRKHEIPELIAKSSDLNFTTTALHKLGAYGWPGNIKQLNNVLEWISIMHPYVTDISEEHLPPDLNPKKTKANDQPSSSSNELNILDMGLREARESFERNYLLSQVNKFDGNISKTAEFIGMERSALHRKLKSLDVFSDNKQSVA